MNIQQLFQDLSFGELATLSLATSGNGVITDAGKEHIIRFANDGLLRLYSRFLLKQNDVLIEMVDWITNYHLSSKFAESQAGISTQTHLYIKDLPEEPFSDDVIKILNVFREDGELPLNNEANALSCFTPQADVLQVPNPENGVALSVGYQAKHPILTLDDLTQEIELPEVLHGALRDWIAFRAYSQVKTQEARIAAQDHAQAYEQACLDVVQNDLVNQTQSSTNNRFELNGWA